MDSQAPFTDFHQPSALYKIALLLLFPLNALQLFIFIVLYYNYFQDATGLYLFFRFFYHIDKILRDTVILC